jgi:hypothetical protein
MAKWKESPATTTDLMLTLYGGRITKNNKALQQLFPVYCQRVDLWHQCIPMLAYAALREPAEKRFGDRLMCHPKRSSFYFSLSSWQKFISVDGTFWPIQVMVREQFDPKATSQRFVVMSFIKFDSVDEALEESLMNVAKVARDKNLRRKQRITDGQDSVTLKVDFASDQADAAKKLLTHLIEFDRELSGTAAS